MTIVLDGKQGPNSEQGDGNGNAPPIPPDNLDNLTWGELSEVARQHCRERGDRSTWVAGATKDKMIRYIRTGDNGDGNGGNGNGDGDGKAKQQPRGKADNGGDGGDGGEQKQPPVPPRDGLEQRIYEIAQQAAQPIADAGDGKIIRALGQAIGDALDDAEQSGRFGKGGNKPAFNIVIEKGEPVVIDADTYHKSLPDVLKLVRRGARNIWLVGPAGTGKTTLSRQFAAALKRNFTYNSCSAATAESTFYGKRDILPDGSTGWTTPDFVKAYRDGGVHLLDEVDACDENALVSLNAPLDNGTIVLPSGEVIERHPDSVVIVAANTYGLGADRVYVGRNQLDGAFRDRFVLKTVEVDYDTDLERGIAHSIVGDNAKAKAEVDRLCDWVVKLREAIAREKVRRIASSRLVIEGARWIEDGEKVAAVADAYFADWNPDDRKRCDH